MVFERDSRDRYDIGGYNDEQIDPNIILDWRYTRNRTQKISRMKACEQERYNDVSRMKAWEQERYNDVMTSSELAKRFNDVMISGKLGKSSRVRFVEENSKNNSSNYNITSPRSIFSSSKDRYEMSNDEQIDPNIVRGGNAKNETHKPPSRITPCEPKHCDDIRTWDETDDKPFRVRYAERKETINIREWDEAHNNPFRVRYAEMKETINTNKMPKPNTRVSSYKDRYETKTHGRSKAHGKERNRRRTKDRYGIGASRDRYASIEPRGGNNIVPRDSRNARESDDAGNLSRKIQILTKNGRKIDKYEF